MAFEPEDFTASQLEAANNLFKRGTKFVLGVAGLEQLPADDLPEVAFAGRSNVGKSSIINALFNQKKLAKTASIIAEQEGLFAHKKAADIRK